MASDSNVGIGMVPTANEEATALEHELERVRAERDQLAATEGVLREAAELLWNALANVDWTRSSDTWIEGAEYARDKYHAALSTPPPAALAAVEARAGAKALRDIPFDKWKQDAIDKMNEYKGHGDHPASKELAKICAFEATVITKVAERVNDHAAQLESAAQAQATSAAGTPNPSVPSQGTRK